MYVAVDDGDEYGCQISQRIDAIGFDELDGSRFLTRSSEKTQRFSKFESQM
jgi:hypothetical protein